MLVLTRKVGESIRAGNVVVTVLSNRHGVMRIGIEAPQDVKLLRTELADVTDSLTTESEE